MQFTALAAHARNIQARRHMARYQRVIPYALLRPHPKPPQTPVEPLASNLKPRSLSEPVKERPSVAILIPCRSLGQALRSGKPPGQPEDSPHQCTAGRLKGAHSNNAGLYRQKQKHDPALYNYI